MTSNAGGRKMTEEPCETPWRPRSSAESPVLSRSVFEGVCRSIIGVSSYCCITKLWRNHILELRNRQPVSKSITASSTQERVFLCNTDLRDRMAGRSLLSLLPQVGLR